VIAAVVIEAATVGAVIGLCFAVAVLTYFAILSPFVVVGLWIERKVWP
jgi:hypothetical protein